MKTATLAAIAASSAALSAANSGNNFVMPDWLALLLVVLLIGIVAVIIWEVL